MNETLKIRLVRAFQLTHDLILHLEESALRVDIPNLPSNRISGQMWCVVGARESYMNAIEHSAWQGFSCSVKTPDVKRDVLAALEETQNRLSQLNFTDLNEKQTELVFDLLEHEIQHHGQLIRFIYGNRLTFPQSWNTRYTV